MRTGYEEMQDLANSLIYRVREAEDAPATADKRMLRMLDDNVQAVKGNILLHYNDIYKTSFSALREANIARNAEWNKTGEPLRPSFRGNEAGGEAGETIEAVLANLLQFSVAMGRVQNVLKKIERGQLGLAGSTATVSDLADELADAQICLDLIAMDFDIDMFEATRTKFNRTSDKLGFKTKL